MFDEKEVELHYKEELLAPAKEAAQNADLDMSYAGWDIEVADMMSIPNDEYALHRRKGLGGSDASIVLGVNPYKTQAELIEEKARDTLTAEEKAVGDKVAVRKGRDLEPLIVDKWHTAYGKDIWKPRGMYICRAHPYLKMNFDGVAGEPRAYYPVEIKVVTAVGERHYNPKKAVYTEALGHLPLPEDVSKMNMSIVNKAAHYGIPPYYYTQLQQEMMASGAPYGYLCALYDSSWRIFTYFAWRDEAVIKDIILNGYKIWEKVVAKNPERAIVQ